MHYTHTSDSVKNQNQSKLRRMNSTSILFSKNSNHSRDLSKLTVNDIDDWQETSEDLLKLFVLYLHKIDCLYDRFPSVYSKIYTVDSDKVPETLKEYLDSNKLLLRNGGCFRIIINILIILIDGQNSQKHMLSVQQETSKKTSKEIYTIFDKLIKDKSDKESAPRN